jgi:pSer/pThr/pTyr-binding forkhead associated (FHA) protein
MLQYVLRFVAGKDQGREFPLPPDLNIVIGRVSDVDVLLLDRKVSRKHAKISTHGGQVFLEDLASRNGTFVNGDRIRNVELKEGDEILIGSSTIKLVSLAEATPRAPQPAAPQTGQAPGPPLPAVPALISGSIHEMPLADLLQLFTNSRKSGILTIQADQGRGKVYLRDGHVYFAEIEDNPVVKPRKAFYRMFMWTEGTFDLKPVGDGDHHVAEEITESTTSLVLEGVRQLDEIRILEPKLPRRGSRMHAAGPLPGNLRDLATEEIQLFQLILHHNTLEPVIDSFPGTDFEAYTCLLDLIRRGFVTVG